MMDSYILRQGRRQFSDLFLCFCGYEECAPGHSFGPAVRPNYIVHYILKGRGVFQTGGASYALEAGQGFLIKPGVQTVYRADGKEPWTYLWVGFDGERAAEYLLCIGLGESRLTFRSGQGERLKEIVLEMLRHNTYTAANQFMLEGLLYAFFSALAQDLDTMAPAGEKDGSLYVRRAVEFIQNNYCRPIQITDVADYVCVNRSYLYTLFGEELGASPQEYLANYRLTRAAELLLITDFSVESVALSCGYRDPLVFSKAFKEQNGVPPSRYRRMRIEQKQAQKS